MSKHASMTSTSMHVSHAYTYANASARTSATGFVSGDLGKIALQSDINAFFELIATTPTWVQISSSLTTKGDLPGTSGSDVVNRLAIGTDGQVLTADSASTNGFKWAASTGGGATYSYELVNLGLATSVGSNLLTVNLKQSDGSSAPSAGASAVKLAFRDSTLANGQYFERSVTSALSISTVATGASFGTTSAQNAYIYVYAIDNAGTVELALAGNMIFDEGKRYNTTAIGAGSTDGQTLYSTSARTNVAVRLIGRLMVNETTAGTYASNATEVTMVPFNHIKPLSRVSVSNGNGHGSTNTVIRRFTTTNENIGINITYADSATLGATFTINSPGVYRVDYTDGHSGSDNFFGVSLNTSTPTSSINGLSYANGFRGASCSVNAAGGQQVNMGVTLNCVAGDVIRAHTDGGVTNGSLIGSNFTVTQVS